MARVPAMNLIQIGGQLPLSPILLVRLPIELNTRIKGEENIFSAIGSCGSPHTYVKF
ncbi:hypothetical protein ACVWWO_001947 [Bradyrhizobium sp. F1.13.1]